MKRFIFSPFKPVRDLSVVLCLIFLIPASGHWFSSMGFFRKIARICLKKRKVSGFPGCLSNMLILNDFPLN